MENMCVELLAGSCQCHQSVMNQSWMFMPAAPYRENNNQTCFHRGGEVRHQASRHPQLNLPPITPITPTTSGASKGPGKMAPMVSELNQTKARFQSANFEWQIQQSIRPITPPTHFYCCSATECIQVWRKSHHCTGCQDRAEHLTRFSSQQLLNDTNKLYYLVVLWSSDRRWP